MIYNGIDIEKLREALGDKSVVERVMKKLAENEERDHLNLIKVRNQTYSSHVHCNDCEEISTTFLDAMFSGMRIKCSCGAYLNLDRNDFERDKELKE